MKIVLLVRQLLLAPDQPSPAVLGACEAAAFRVAAALAASRPGATLCAIAVGPPREDAALAWVAAAGARAVRLWDPVLAEVDYDGYARAIAATARLCGYDLVLAGERSADEGLGAIGPATAEHLGIPHLTAAHDIGWHRPGGLCIKRREAGAVRTLLGAAPLLLTVTADARGPARETMTPPPAPGAGAAIEVLELARVGVRPEELRTRRQYLGALGPRSPAPAEILPDAVGLLARLRAAGLTGGSR
jgi:electron transfer flavoprotein beta subunit